MIPMRGDVMLAGRNGDLALADDPFVADTQMRLFFSGARLAVEDVGGGNGVFTRLRAEREVSTGGEVRVGRQRLVVEPIPALSPAEDGATAWGSPDAGYRFRLVQLLEGGIRGGAFPAQRRRQHGRPRDRRHHVPAPTASSRGVTPCCTSRPIACC